MVGAAIDGGLPGAGTCGWIDRDARACIRDVRRLIISELRAFENLEVRTYGGG